jgi:hypothetical protein
VRYFDWFDKLTTGKLSAGKTGVLREKIESIALRRATLAQDRRFAVIEIES